MEHRQRLSWLSALPNEILLEIFDQLNRLQLNYLTRVNKQFHTLAQYILEHKKKIRFCGDISRVLVLTLPSTYDEVQLDSPSLINGSTTIHASIIARGAVFIKTFFELATYFHSFNSEIGQEISKAFNNGGKSRRISMIRPPNKKNLRQKLWIDAVAADLCLFIVDPEEIDTHSEEIKELIFGSCFMMSARNVIVAVDLHCNTNSSQTQLCQLFNQAKAKMSKLLDRTVGMCYKIVPINIKTGCNITQGSLKYEWFSGPSLKQLILDDQLRTNFDESAYAKLCKEPLKIQLSNCHRIGGIGTVPVGRVLSGMLIPGDEIRFYPQIKFYGQGPIQGRVYSIEAFNEGQGKGMPGDVVGFNVNRVSKREIVRRFCYAVSIKETKTVNCTFAFRASIVVFNSDRFTQHQVYNVFYGTSRIRCILWWIFPEESKNHDRDERKFKIGYDQVPQKLIKKPVRYLVGLATYREQKKEYVAALKEEKKRRSKMQVELQISSATSYVRPPKPKLKKAKAILLPLNHYDIETYKPTEFEKNYRGKVMLTEKGSIIGVGRVDRVLSYSSETFKTPTNRDYREQYSKVVSQASELFNLPTEQKMLELFLGHVTSNKHAKKSIQRQKSKSKL
eukprot:TRINITY_DN1504_c0_g1_i2.p1 TRINITY_DN1504_c0_g1~~TRINITY_DN1504_c0_g1_i2.p1  ORF type:complete len:639 (-),score=67.33 TRINITY_DN1504_c0_g1_i2:27-1883(-)